MPGLRSPYSSMTQVRISLKIAIIGCGAIAEQIHIPIIAGHECCSLVALVDQNTRRAKQLADAYSVKMVLADASELNRSDVDAAIICTPPAHHAACAIELLNRGIHVLVEKPMATAYDDALRMVKAAADSGAVLSVGLFRRLFPCLSLLKSALDSRLLGEPTSVRLLGGAMYGWNAATLGNLLKRQAGGGVLMDMGPHYFDQLLYVFGGVGNVVSYSDNADGGVETDCHIELALNWNGKAIPCRLELSRSRNLSNELIVECDKGELAIPPSERFQIHIRPHEIKFSDPNSGSVRRTRSTLQWDDQIDESWMDTYRHEIDDFVNAIKHQREATLSGASALSSMKLIDDCYRNRKTLEEPWRDFPAELSLLTCAILQRGIKTIAITGASGFIGCRVAEILSRQSGIHVKCAVRTPANASRLARLNVEMCLVNVLEKSALTSFLSGCDALIDCSVGTDYWDPKAVRNVTVEGARNLAAVAKAVGVAQIVHLSTMSVYSANTDERIDAGTLPTPSKHDGYGRAKLRGDELFLNSGVKSVILRPGCVYGPFGKTFIVNPIMSLQKGLLCLSGSEDKASNTIHVDNVVEAVCRSLAIDSLTNSMALPIADDDGATWGEFYRYFAVRMGKNIVVEPNFATRNGKSHSDGFLRQMKALVKSHEAKALASKFLWSTAVGRRARGIVAKRPALHRWAKSAMGMELASVHRQASHGATGELLRITPFPAVVSSDDARRALGWIGVLPRELAMQRTWEWLVYSGIAKCVPKEDICPE